MSTISTNKFPGRRGFVETIFGADAEHAWVTHVPDVENKADKASWLGGPLGNRDMAGTEWSNENCYFCTSLFDSGKPRNTHSWRASPVLLLDDVTQKGVDPSVVLKTFGRSPTFITQTSPVSQQWGYVFNEPCTDRDTYLRLVNACIIRFFGGKDPGMSNPTRYGRLPWGFNTKEDYLNPIDGTAPPVTLKEWNPDNRFTVLELSAALGDAWDKAPGGRLSSGRVVGPAMSVADAVAAGDYFIEAFDVLGWVGPLQGDGYVAVKCPWQKTHTVDDDRTGWNSGAYLAGRDGFKCFHADDGNAPPDRPTPNHVVEAKLREEFDAEKGAGEFDKLKAGAEQRALQLATAHAKAVFQATADATTFAPRALEVRKGMLHVMVDEGLKRLKEQGVTYQRGGKPVCIKRILVQTTNGGRVLPRIVHMKRSTMQAALSSAARWVETRHDKTTGQNVFVDCDVPENVAQVIVDMVLGLDDHLDPLEAIASAPFIQADGTVLQVNGAPRYDAATRLWLDAAGVDFLPVLDAECTRADALRALEVLSYPISQYDFDSETSKTVALASMLLPFVRPAITVAPGIAVEAPLKGSGKTKLATLPAILATGEPPPLLTSPGRAEELDKRFIASLLGGASSVVIDNISEEDNAWGTDTICSAITAEALQLRPLGSSNAQNITNKAIVTVTGNNITYPGDTTRRFLVCRITPRHATPHKRDDFTFDPETEVKQNRVKYVHAVLTILRAFVLAGSPPQKGVPLGSFEEFNRRVRDALLWLGLPDVAEATAADRAEAGPEQSELADVLEGWAGASAINMGAHKSGDIVKAADDMASRGLKDLQAAIANACGGRLDKVALGRWLNKNKDRQVNGLSFCGRKDRKGVMVWILNDHAAGPPQPSAPQPSAPQPVNEDEEHDASEAAAVEAAEHARRVEDARRAFGALQPTTSPAH
jgi:putative DNA primase/helicase